MAYMAFKVLRLLMLNKNFLIVKLAIAVPEEIRKEKIRICVGEKSFALHHVENRQKCDGIHLKLTNTMVFVPKMKNFKELVINFR